MRALLTIFTCLVVLFVQGQNTSQNKIKTTVDRSQILMGEEIKVSISIATDGTELIVFPELKNIGRLEVIENYPVDSVRENSKLTLFKRYGVTQWDSGDYWVRPIEITRNTEKYKTDSLLVKVREVKTDTTKQKMYPIKDSVKLPFKNKSDFNYWWLLLLLLIPIGIVAFMLLRKRTQKTYEETLQPFEWTKYRLQKLDESHNLESRNWKEYYTELTYIIRKYLDSKVYGHALESTTDQLLNELKTAMSEKGMSITTTTQARLEAILHRADLVKFAGASGDGITAKEDRLHVNDIIYNINQVLPQPTEDELLQDAKYRRKLARKKQLRKIALITSASLIALVLGFIAFGFIKGWDNVKDAVYGNELRDIYEQEWLTTTYGRPELRMSTPAILIRKDSSAVKGIEFFKDFELTKDAFTYNKMGDAWSMELLTYTFPGQALKEDEELPSEIIFEPFLDELENAGAKEIVAVDDKVTRDGLKGVLVTGTYKYKEKEYEFRLELIANGAGVQYIVVRHLKDNEDKEERQYGRLIRERIFESLELVPIQEEKKQAE